MTLAGNKVGIQNVCLAQLVKGDAQSICLRRRSFFLRLYTGLHTRYAFLLWDGLHSRANVIQP